MIKNLIPFYLLLCLMMACSSPVAVDNKADIIHIEKIDRETDILAQHPKLQFEKSPYGGYDFYDERFMQYYGVPVKRLNFSIEDDEVHIQTLNVYLFNEKEGVNALKKKLTTLYGKPGADSTHEFSFAEKEDISVWKNNHILIGLKAEKDDDTKTKMERAPEVHIAFLNTTSNNHE
jgi:hypothetical protein